MTSQVNHNSFTKLVLDKIQRFPQRPALRYIIPGTKDIRDIRYGELLSIIESQMEEFVNKFTQSGLEVSKLRTISILGTSGHAYLFTLLGLTFMNLIPICLSTRNALVAHQHLLLASDCPVLFYSEEYKGMATDLKSILKQENHKDLVIFQLPSFEQALGFPHTESLQSLTIDKSVGLEHPFAALHTSGTTGIPRLVYLSGNMFQAMCDIAQQYMQSLEHVPEVTIRYVLAPLFHAAGLFISFLGLAQGHTMVLPMEEQWPPNPEYILGEIQLTNTTVLETVPFLLQQLVETIEYLKLNWNILTSLDRVGYGGASCPKALGNFVTNHGVNLVSYYGSTECGLVMHGIFERNKNKGRWDRMKLYANVRSKWLVRDELQHEAEEVSGIPGDQLYELVILKGNPTTAIDQSNTPEGDFRTGDLFFKDKDDPALYTLYRRVDGLIVHVTGEKSNPYPIEEIIEEKAADVVERVCVIGNKRFCNCLLVQPKGNVWAKLSQEKIEQEVWKAVAYANTQIPKHSVISKNMIVVLDSQAKLPTTDKGSLRRKTIEQENLAKIEELYKSFQIGPGSDTSEAQMEDLAKKSEGDLKLWLLAKVCELLGSTDIDPSVSLFSQGFDSLTATQFQNTVLRKCLASKHVPSNFIYQISSVNQLAKYIHQALKSSESKIAVDLDWYKIAEDMFAKYSDYQYLHETREKLCNTIKLYPNVEFRESSTGGARTYLITGATGSVGNFVLLRLLQQPANQVTTIYCVIRRPQTKTQSSAITSANESEILGKNKLIQAFQSRKLDTTILNENLDNGRVQILLCDLEDKNLQLGFSNEQYCQLAYHVTHIIHIAWKMDFNNMITEFESSCIRPTYALLQLSTLKRQKQFTFISSISTCLNYPSEPVIEEIHHNVTWSHQMGYGESKLLAERLTTIFKQKYRMLNSVQVIRVGQIMGDSTNGVWNTAEHIPLLIQAGQSMKKLPDHYFGDVVDWVPVDYCAQTIIELTEWLDSVDVPDVPVSHLVNPHPKSYQEVVHDLGLNVQQVSSKEWIESLKQMNPADVPAAKLANFFEQSFGSQRKIVFDTQKTAQRSATMKSLPAVKQSWIQASIQYWKSIGFLQQS